jgi:hypothetical protein
MRRFALAGLLCLFCCACLGACRGPEETSAQTATKRARGAAVDPKDVQQ